MDEMLIQSENQEDGMDVEEVKEIKKILAETKDKTTDEIRQLLKGTKVHAITVQKGGVGKSTITSDLAFTLAKKGFKVLAIDLDPQASLSELCNIPIEEQSIKGTKNALDTIKNIIDYSAKNEGKRRAMLTEEEYMNTIHKMIQHPTYKKYMHHGMNWELGRAGFGFDIIPTNIQLSVYEGTLLYQYNVGGRFLYYVIENIKKYENYDFILIDCLPGLNILCQIGILAGVDGAIVPMNLESLSLIGAQNLIDIVFSIQNAWNTHTDETEGEKHKGILGVVKNQYAGRYTKVQGRFEEVVEKLYPLPFNQTIPQSTNCNTAHEKGRVYSEFDTKAGIAYDELADEVIARDIYRSRDDYQVVTVKRFGKEVYKELRKNK